MSKQRDPKMDFGFYAAVPRIIRTGYKQLSVHQKHLYFCLKDLCGEHGTCFRTIAVLVAETDLSAGEISKGIPALHKAGLIHAEKKKRSASSSKAVWHITIVDIWQANGIAHPTKQSSKGEYSLHEYSHGNSQESSQNEGEYSPHEQEYSPHEQEYSPHEFAHSCEGASGVLGDTQNEGVSIIKKKHYQLKHNQEEEERDSVPEQSPPPPPSDLSLKNSQKDESTEQSINQEELLLSKASPGARIVIDHWRPVAPTRFKITTNLINSAESLACYEPLPTSELLKECIDWSVKHDTKKRFKSRKPCLTEISYDYGNFINDKPPAVANDKYDSWRDMMKRNTTGPVQDDTDEEPQAESDKEWKEFLLEEYNRVGVEGMNPADVIELQEAGLLKESAPV